MKLADYLFTRLHQLGVRDIIGVPGDFNLHLLDFVVPNNLSWIGTCNELNAGYAADGYSRIRGISAMITTFGVGELSALNAIAGAYAERAPVVHIVGTPASHMQSGGARVHHTFNDGEFRRFAKLAKEVTCAQADLKDASTAAEMIDQTLAKCLTESRPVYIELPGDMVEADVDAERLKKEIVLPADAIASTGHVLAEDKLMKVLDELYTAEKAIVLVDGETRSMACAELVRQFVAKSELPAFYTQFGKGILDETQPNVRGLHSANIGEYPTDKAFEDADLVIVFGPHYSGTNSYMQRTVPSKAKTLSFTHNGIYMRDDKPITSGLFYAKPALAALLQKFDSSKLKKQSLDTIPTHPSSRGKPQQPEPSTKLTQDAFYASINSLLRPGDVVMGETGTPSWATRSLHFPPGCSYIGATTWLSIGYMLPSALGVALARRATVSEAKDIANGNAHAAAAASMSDAASANGRVLLFIGDGSFQMTAQELSTIIHHRLPVTVFLINNSGYTIERCLHGWRAAYNDVVPWEYAALAKTYGGEVGAWKVGTFGELEKVLKSEGFQKEGPKFVELLMSRDDAPEVLLSLTSRPPKD